MENGLITILLIVLLIISIFVGILVGRSKRNKAKIGFFILLLIGLFLVSIFDLSMNWGASRWGRESAFQVANNFLVTMQQGDYLGATDYMRPCVQEFVGVEGLGNVEQTRPISWQLAEDKMRNNRSITLVGSAVFINGSELRIEIDMRWNGLKWEIDGVTFGEPYHDPLIQFNWGC